MQAQFQTICLCTKNTLKNLQSNGRSGTRQQANVSLASLTNLRFCILYNLQQLHIQLKKRIVQLRVAAIRQGRPLPNPGHAPSAAPDSRTPEPEHDMHVPQRLVVSTHVSTIVRSFPTPRKGIEILTLTGVKSWDTKVFIIHRHWKAILIIKRFLCFIL
jgi:hypothetical protein